MALTTSTQDLVNDMIEENQNLPQLIQKPLPTKLEDCEFLKNLPETGRSIFYGLEYYQHYRNITLTKLQHVLTSSEFGFVFLSVPCLVYSSAKMAIFYVINIQFKQKYDTILSQVVTDRGEKIPTWIISLRQQLPFLDILPMSRPRSFFQQSQEENGFLDELKPSGPAFSIYIDFRRVPPPNWVREIKVSHLLDDTVNVQSLIKQDPFDVKKVAEYKKQLAASEERIQKQNEEKSNTSKKDEKELSSKFTQDAKDISAFMEEKQDQIQKQLAKASVYKTTTAEILASTISPKEMLSNQHVAHKSQKQTDIQSLFKKMAESVPPPSLKRPLTAVTTTTMMVTTTTTVPNTQEEGEPPTKRARLDPPEEVTPPGVKSFLPVSNAVKERPLPTPSKKKKSVNVVPVDAMDIDADAEPPKLVSKKKRSKKVSEPPSTMTKFLTKTKEPIQQEFKPFTIPTTLTQEESNLLAALKRWFPEDKNQLALLLRTYLSGPHPNRGDKPNPGIPFIHSYLWYLQERMNWCQDPKCTTFNQATKSFIKTLYSCSVTAAYKDVLIAKLLGGDDQSPLECFLTKRKMEPADAVRIELIEYNGDLTRKCEHKFLIHKSKLSFLKTISVACSFAYSSYKEMKKHDANHDQVVSAQSDILEVIVSLLNRW